MKRMIPALVLNLTALSAGAVGNIADIAIVDRDTGRALPTYRHDGVYWVAGTPGTRYGISIRNCLGARLLAVVSVDGVNVITGDTAAWDQTGYVFRPWEAYPVTGWRKSDAEVATFSFTAPGDAYATRTGRPTHLGVIGVALFYERAPKATIADATRFAAPALPASAGAEQPLAAESQTAPAATLDVPADRARYPTPAQQLGTGHGAREASSVSHTDFERLSSTPQEVIRIRYDSRENLIALGIIPGRSRVVAPNPFPGEPVLRYAPDPPGVR